MSFIGIIMLMGLVAKNAILLLDAARKREARGHGPRGGADARRPHAPAPDPDDDLRADRRHVAGGASALGEGGEFYRPMAVAIIGGTITSTLLTLLVVPTFYDSIEIARDRMVAKFRRRAARFNIVVALLLTTVEVLLTLTLIRFVFRSLKKPCALPWAAVTRTRWHWRKRKRPWALVPGAGKGVSYRKSRVRVIRLFICAVRMCHLDARCRSRCVMGGMDARYGCAVSDARCGWEM